MSTTVSIARLGVISPIVLLFIADGGHVFFRILSFVCQQNLGDQHLLDNFCADKSYLTHAAFV